MIWAYNNTITLKLERFKVFYYWFVKQTSVGHSIKAQAKLSSHKHEVLFRYPILTQWQEIALQYQSIKDYTLFLSCKNRKFFSIGDSNSHIAIHTYIYGKQWVNTASNTYTHIQNDMKRHRHYRWAQSPNHRADSKINSRGLLQAFRFVYIRGFLCIAIEASTTTWIQTFPKGPHLKRINTTRGCQYAFDA